MQGLKRLAVWAAMIAICVAPATAVAAAKDAVPNKEGYWAIDIDHGGCVATMTLQGGSFFVLRAVKGRLSFGLLAGRTPIARAETGRIETEAYGVDFKPSYTPDALALFYRGDLDA